jgi:FkbM family methyltransferase
MTFGALLVRVAGWLSPVGYSLLLAWQQGWLRHPQGEVTVRLRDGRVLRCVLSDRTQLTMALGVFEPAESRLVARVLEAGDTYVDVGAHIGWFATIAGRRVGSDGLVIACEPYPENAAALRANLELNHVAGARLVEMAIGSMKGVLSLAGYDSGGITALDWVEGSRIEVAMTTLDDVTAGVGDITLLKIDVEGWERHVLLGGPQTLTRTRNVLIEVNGPALLKAGTGRAEIFGLLRAAGFATFTPVVQGGLRRLERPTDVTNYLASR